jgi:hypothetical protein
MQKHVIDILEKHYFGLSFRRRTTYLKYSYDFNKVNVNVFFDAYDTKSESLTMVLVYEKDYYFTPLNIRNREVNPQYLNKIPQSILENILVDNKLNDFFQKMAEKISQEKPRVNLYQNDKLFTLTVKSNKARTKLLPFWLGVRHTRMSNDTLRKLSETADIDEQVLHQIQDKGLTLVRTEQANRRKDLTLILGKQKIYI